MRVFIVVLILVIVVLFVNKKRVITVMENTKLGPNFDLSEFVRTSTGLDNVPGHKEVENLRTLVTNILQPLRNYLGRPIVITSGYRSPLVNSVIGGSDTSDHVHGRAADIYVDGFSPTTLVQIIRNLGLPFDQVIDEQLWKFNPISGWRLSKWVHVSYNHERNRRQAMTARNTQENTAPVYKNLA